MEENVSTRLKHFIDAKGLSVSQFADRCGIARPTLSQLLTGRNKKISDSIIRSVHDTFPELNIMWLLFGEGEMGAAYPANQAVSSPADADYELDVPQVRCEPSVPYGARFYPSSEFDDDASSLAAANGLFDDFGMSGSQNASAGVAGGYEREKREYQTSVNADNQSGDRKYSTQTPLSHGVNAPKTDVNQLIAYDLKIRDLERQIAEIRQNPRKVAQITVYYDDNTFETFLPKS